MNKEVKGILWIASRKLFRTSKVCAYHRKDDYRKLNDFLFNFNMNCGQLLGLLSKRATFIIGGEPRSL